MEQSVLRPKPMPGREHGGPAPEPARRPGRGRRRRRRLTTVLTGLFAGTLLVLAGVGAGTVGAGVIGMSKLAELRQQGEPGGPGAPGASRAPAAAPAGGPPPSRAPARATLGVEVVDTARPGALVTGVHVPGPGHSAGLVRGDLLLAFGRTRIDSAADLADAVARARPGAEVRLTVRHAGGGYQQLTVVPGVVT